MFGSLFEYAKEVGVRLFTSDVEAAMNILRHIEANNPGVNPLHVEYDDGCVTLKGIARDVAAREKCILMAGNVRGVEKVNADSLDVDRPRNNPHVESAPPLNPAVETDSTPETLPEPEPAASRFYTIQKGDTLWKIAASTLGKGARYPEIFEANREVILDPDKIYPGQKIRIPG